MYSSLPLLSSVSLDPVGAAGRAAELLEERQRRGVQTAQGADSEATPAAQGGSNVCCPRKERRCCWLWHEGDALPRGVAASASAFGSKRRSSRDPRRSPFTSPSRRTRRPSLSWRMPCLGTARMMMMLPDRNGDADDFFFWQRCSKQCITVVDNDPAANCVTGICPDEEF